jgi:hypothetical protein
MLKAEDTTPPVEILAIMQVCKIIKLKRIQTDLIALLFANLKFLDDNRFAFMIL